MSTCAGARSPPDESTRCSTDRTARGKIAVTIDG
jgi:hypothetical protein